MILRIYRAGERVSTCSRLRRYQQGRTTWERLRGVRAQMSRSRMRKGLKCEYNARHGRLKTRIRAVYYSASRGLDSRADTYLQARRIPRLLQQALAGIPGRHFGHNGGLELDRLHSPRRP